MNPVPVYAMAAFLILLNGGLLGLMQRDLPDEMQKAATWWRRSTLLVAGGAILMGIQAWLPRNVGHALGNGLLMLGLTGYWVALRHFDGLARSWWQAAHAALGVLLVPVFTFIGQPMSRRVVVVTVLWWWVAFGIVTDLRRSPEKALSRTAMKWLFVLLGVFTLVRMLYFQSPASKETSLLDGTFMSVLTPVVSALLPMLGTTIFLLMASERLRRQWEQSASTDALTGLANRRTVASQGQRRLNLTQPLAVAVIDVDHFKSVNDRYGHEGGDAALVHVARCLTGACRAGDMPARHGGEEFMVLFDAETADVAQAVGERLRRAVEHAPARLTEQHTVALTVSVGVAVAQPAELLDSVIRRADEALYRAKDSGRNRVEFSQH